MDIEVKRQPERTELRVEILAPEGDCPPLQRLLAFLAAEDPAIPAQREGERRRLAPEDILRLYGEDKAVRAQTADGAYTVPLRLYELEERLRPFRFARISHSEIVNLGKVRSLDLKLSGTVRLILTDGTVCYASRRYVKRIREAEEGELAAVIGEAAARTLWRQLHSPEASAPEAGTPSP